MSNRSSRSPQHKSKPVTSGLDRSKLPPGATVKLAGDVEPGDLIEFGPGCTIPVSGVKLHRAKGAAAPHAVTLIARGSDRRYRLGVELICHGSVWSVTA